MRPWFGLHTQFQESYTSSGINISSIQILTSMKLMKRTFSTGCTEFHCRRLYCSIQYSTPLATRVDFAEWLSSSATPKWYLVHQIVQIPSTIRPCSQNPIDFKSITVAWEELLRKIHNSSIRNYFGIIHTQIQNYKQQSINIELVWVLDVKVHII